MTRKVNASPTGTLTSMSCDPTANGFSATNTYVIGPNGEEMTEVDKGTFVHTNVSAAGELIATIKSDGPHFTLSDWLGTRGSRPMPPAMSS